MISISVNGEPTEIADSITIEGLLDSIETPPNYLAVERNGEVVPREDYGDVMVVEGDEIELVTLVGGG